MNAMPATLRLDSAGIKWAGGFLGERKKRASLYYLLILLDPKIGIRP